MLGLSNPWRRFQLCQRIVKLRGSSTASGQHFLPKLLSGIDGLEGTGNDLFGADPQRIVGQPMLEQLGIGQDDAQLVVEAVEQPNHFLWNRRIGCPAAGQRCVRRHGSAGHFSLGLGNGDGFRLAPERVREDADRAAGGPDVLDLAAAIQL